MKLEAASPTPAPAAEAKKLPRHKFWGAGEPDCPKDLKAPNGELHTMRCKVCGDGWRKSVDVCFAAVPQAALSEEREVNCEECDGSGMRDTLPHYPCTACMGLGKAILSSQTKEAAVPAVDLTPWEKSRFGVFHPDGRFEHLPVDGWESHPLAHTARWAGGILDMQVLRAALAAAPQQPSLKDHSK